MTMSQGIGASNIRFTGVIKGDKIKNQEKKIIWSNDLFISGNAGLFE